MTDVSFYHLTSRPLEWALPRLLEKTLERDWRAVVLMGNQERLEAMNAHLWIWDREQGHQGFLPHGSQSDGHPEHQPIWLTTADENPNGAQALFLADGAQSSRMAEYQRCCELFDGGDEAAVAEARRRWRAYKAAGHAVTYWRQSASGGWEKAG